MDGGLVVLSYVSTVEVGVCMLGEASCVSGLCAVKLCKQSSMMWLST